MTSHPRPFRLERLGEAHDRTLFSCGQEALDRYFQTQVTQDVRRRIAHCYVAVDEASGRIAAYYTLAAASLPVTDLPAELSRKLPRYPTVPAALIGRMAVDRRFQGLGLGGAMLADALERILKSAPAVYAFLVDAKDDKPAAFYRHHGFTPIQGRPRALFLPVSTAMKASGR